MNWWHILLFTNNFVNPQNSCATTTWYIAVDMQLYLLSLVYYAIYFRNESIGRFLLIFVAVGSTMLTGLLTYFNDDWPSISLRLMERKVIYDFAQRGYYSTHVHIGVYAIGIAVGTFLAKNPHFVISKRLQVLGWTLAIICNLTCIYGMYPWNLNQDIPSPIWAGIYSGFHRTGWGLGMAWLSIMCFTGRGGYVNSILSWGAFEVLNRISYLMYLMHLFVVFLIAYSYNGQTDYTYKTMTWTFLGNLSMTAILAACARILFEAPLVELDKIFMEKVSQKEEKVENKKGDKMNSDADRVNTKL